MRTRLLVVVVVLALAAVALADPPKGNTRGPTWLISPGTRIFCGGAPSIATMEIVQPSAFNPPCKPSTYHRELARVWVGPLIMIIVTLLVLVATCLSFFVTRKNSTLTSGGVYISVNSSFLEKSKEGPMACVAFVGFVALIGMTVALVGSDQVHALILNSMQIFRANYQYVEATLSQASSQILALTNSTAATAALVQASTASSVYKDNSDYIMGGFTTLDRLRTTLMVVTALLVALCTIGGAIAISLRWNKLINALLVCGIIGIVLVWVNFLIYALAANVISDMCYTINGCHFCYADGGDVCPLCNAPWFQAMSACPESAQNRFAPVTTFVDSAMDAEAATVCAALETLCASTSPGFACYHAHNCSAHNLRANGLSTAVCLDAEPASNCTTIKGLAESGPPALAADAAAVQDAFAGFQSWSTVYDSLKTLNCASSNAFIESVPLGTYNLLQQTLCPRVENPANPPQQSFAIIAIGLLLAAFSLPLAVFLLHSAKKKPRFSGAPTERSALLSR